MCQKLKENEKNRMKYHGRMEVYLFTPKKSHFELSYQEIQKFEKIAQSSNQGARRYKKSLPGKSVSLLFPGPSSAVMTAA